MFIVFLDLFENDSRQHFYLISSNYNVIYIYVYIYIYIYNLHEVAIYVFAVRNSEGFSPKYVQVGLNKIYVCVVMHAAICNKRFNHYLCKQLFWQVQLGVSMANVAFRNYFSIGKN